MTTFIDELLAEREEQHEQKRIELDRLRADQLLIAIGTLEAELDEVNKLADDEIKLIEEYRSREVGRLEKKVSWLAWNLEQYMRSTDQKTINLIHGSLKLRLGRDKVEIADMQAFLKIATKEGLLRSVPESYEPDMKKVYAHLKTTGEVLPGIAVTPATTKFSYLSRSTIFPREGRKYSPPAAVLSDSIKRDLSVVKERELREYRLPIGRWSDCDS